MLDATAYKVQKRNRKKTSLCIYRTYGYPNEMTTNLITSKNAGSFQ